MGVGLCGMFGLWVPAFAGMTAEGAVVVAWCIFDAPYGLRVLQLTVGASACISAHPNRERWMSFEIAFAS